MKSFIFVSLLMISGSLGLQCFKTNSGSGNIEIEECAASSSSAVCFKTVSNSGEKMKGCRDRPESGYGMNKCKWSVTTLPERVPSENREFDPPISSGGAGGDTDDIAIRCQCNTNLCNGSTSLIPSNLIIMLIFSYIGFVCMK
ncbi:uncharacterized protein LOC111704232 [Eurytemora carolleeae]|uniref:uncharacterized protein LOC111704232 n=1 Tax=Eurytemora carolleeae TaxID=1294199 RepID=UPI000C762EE9|nr:uncharacterized protein LOC111704232 [Eurytemora carolleeae]|eukprot:XP_023332155.1 uncharacterized protein LOC111704232 [Eurytemora affinis]